MKKFLRIIVALLILCLLFASLYAVVESSHDCHGDECPICKVIAVLSAFLSMAVLPILFYSFRQREEAREEAEERGVSYPGTLVLLKVKMSD